MKPCTHVYYGTGKGKTTAAIGLAVRAAGAGCRVLFCQFMKSGETAELSALKNLPGVQIIRPEGCYPFTRQMTEKDRLAITAEHERILDRIMTVLDQPASAADRSGTAGDLSGGNQDSDLPVMVVLDELAWAFHYDLIGRERVLSLLDSEQAEFVITGRVRVPELIERADYVTNLQAEKHPFQKGTAARSGIEF